MIVEEQKIKGIYKITINPFEDSRGSFSRLFCEHELDLANINFTCRQVNHSFTKQQGSFRGLHYQFGKYSEYKLIKCLNGGIIDFGLDLRLKSETFLQIYSLELTDENNTMLLLPPGVAHGFQTLQDNTSLIYFHSSFYNKEFEGGIRYDDKKIKLNLPLPISDISEKDRNHPLIDLNFSGIEYEM